MGGHGPRGEAAIGRGLLAGLGLGRRTVRLDPQLPREEWMRRLAERTVRARLVDLVAADREAALVPRPDGFLLLRRSRFGVGFRPVRGRFRRDGGLDLTVGPPPLAAGLAALLLLGCVSAIVSAPFAIADGDVFVGVSSLVWPPLLLAGFVSTRHDAEWLLDLVTDAAGRP